MKYKQVIVLDTDLSMSKGKMIAQACHASIKAYKKAGKESKDNWEREGQKKIALSNEGEKLEDIFSRAKRNKIPATLIKDAGHTEVEPGTKTAVGIGPAKENEIDDITGHLELIK